MISTPPLMWIWEERTLGAMSVTWPGWAHSGSDTVWECGSVLCRGILGAFTCGVLNGTPHPTSFLRAATGTWAAASWFPLHWERPISGSWDGLRWASMPPANDQVPQWSCTSRASACSYIKPQNWAKWSLRPSRNTCPVFSKKFSKCLSSWNILPDTQQQESFLSFAPTPLQHWTRSHLLKEVLVRSPPLHMVFHLTDFFKSWESLSFLYKPRSRKFTAVASYISSVNCTRSQVPGINYLSPFVYWALLFLISLVIIPSEDQLWVLPAKNIIAKTAYMTAANFLMAKK